jgi:hypothetical protein
MSGPPIVHTEMMYRNVDDQDGDAFWYSKPEKEIYKSVFALVSTLDQNQCERKQILADYDRLYSNEVLPVQLTSRRSGLSRAAARRVTYNVVKSCVNTAAAKIAKAKPKPLFLTSGAGFKLQRKAKKLNKFIDGVFTSMDIYTVAQRAFKDSCIYGTGAIRFYVDDGAKAVRCERVDITELFIDDMEAIYGRPRQIHHKRLVSRALLIEKFPTFKVDIASAAPAKLPDGYRVKGSTADLIEVIESWKLPGEPSFVPTSEEDGDGDEDENKKVSGCRSICIDGATLYSEPYDKDYFPFVFLRWEDPLSGFWGTGLAEELAGIQIEINNLLRVIQGSHKLLGGLRIAIEKGSKVNPSHLNNELGAIIEYTGTKPESLNFTAVSAEIYSHLETLFKRAFEITGISQLSAQSKKPGGLDSGVALREFHDIESERFVLIAQRYENAFMDAARICVDMSRDIYSQYPTYKVNVLGKKFIESIPWKDVDLGEDQYELTVFPVSALPTTPAGRLQTITEMIGNGLLNQDEGKSLLDFPDLEETMSLHNAAVDDIKMIIEHFEDGGDYIAPEPFMNLELARNMMVSALLRAKVNMAENGSSTSDADERILSNMRQFILQVEFMLNPPDMGGAPPPDQGGMGGGDPGLDPGMDPTMGGGGMPPPGMPPLPGMGGGMPPMPN